jgi:hypothetical protein
MLWVAKFLEIVVAISINKRENREKLFDEGVEIVDKDIDMNNIVSFELSIPAKDS